jgi:hypothetical protein
MRGVVILVGGLLLMLAWAGGAPARPPPVAFTECLPPPAVRPAEILLACGDGTESFSVTRWMRWTRRSARAVGTAEINDCTPSCVAGRVHAYRAAVVLDRPQTCGGRVLFTRLHLVLARRPGGGQPAGSLVLCRR